MKTVKDFDVKGKRVLTRVDFNVPLNDDFVVTDDTRMRAALPTINWILEQGGSLVLMSHLGRPKNGPENKFSLSHLVAPLSELTGVEVKFATDCIGEEAESLSANLKPGEILLLENLRFYDEEKKGDVDFAGKLAKHGDMYVNDAFGTAHRAHASTAIIAQFFPETKAFGLLMASELTNIGEVMENARKPFTAVIGGAKVSSKISIIENLLDKIDNLIIGGGMSYTFVKAMGGEVGSSLVEDDFLETAREVMKKADENGVRILLPQDSVIADNFNNEAERKTVASNQIDSGWMGLDIGPEAVEHNSLCLEESKTILWNGPMGVFEMENFSAGTRDIAYSVVKATERGAFSLVGGGDSVAAVNKYNLKEHVSYVSTGGGAMLESIEGKLLPGVAAIQNN
ncbi:phosphoglycerate kinase [bacterium SCSIO 12741]|nr:phosphoglycerate kinase [bacterium SCSIO 12741]